MGGGQEPKFAPLYIERIAGLRGSLYREKSHVGRLFI
jgi:hypothetical protein